MIEKSIYNNIFDFLFDFGIDFLIEKSTDRTGPDFSDRFLFPDWTGPEFSAQLDFCRAVIWKFPDIYIYIYVYIYI